MPQANDSTTVFCLATLAREDGVSRSDAVARAIATTARAWELPIKAARPLAMLDQIARYLDMPVRDALEACILAAWGERQAAKARELVDAGMPWKLAQACTRVVDAEIARRPNGANGRRVGNAAALKALASFDPARGKFSTFVRREVRRAVCKDARRSLPRAA